VAHITGMVGVLEQQDGVKFEVMTDGSQSLDYHVTAGGDSLDVYVTAYFEAL